MRFTILLLPTLLAAGFVLALSTEISAPRATATFSSRAGEIRELHQLLDKTSSRLTVLEPTPHNFVPRGASATEYPTRPIAASCPILTVTDCAVNGRVTTHRTS